MNKTVLKQPNVLPVEKSMPHEWLQEELAGSDFKDKRLNKRFVNLLENLWQRVGKSIPFACQDWANTKAAYRFLNNEKVSEQEILTGHFQSTKARCAQTKGPLLVLHDTTEFSYQRNRPEEIGAIGVVVSGRKAYGQLQRYTKCGILMHSSLVITTEGLPLGISAIKFWTRKKFKGCNALKKHINPTRVAIEKKESYRWLENIEKSTSLLACSERCVHIGDRESDIYELFCTAKEIGTHFLVRTCVDRRIKDGKQTILAEMKTKKVKNRHIIDVVDKKGKRSKAQLEIKYSLIKVLPPIGKQKSYPALSLTVIHAEERGNPKNRTKISWKLITDLPVLSGKDAVEKLTWYSMRWKIESFHKILKSGCKAEESKLRTAQRIANLISVYCIISWRIFWLTMINRVCPTAPPEIAFTKTEIKILDRIRNKKTLKRVKGKRLSDYIIEVAKLGGYLDRASDPPPGNIIMWRGISRLTDLHVGVEIS